MRTVGLALLLVPLVPLGAWTPERAHAWGQEGHSIVADIAQRRLDTGTLEKIKALLKSEAPDVEAPQVALASIASWADDYRSKHPESSNWHFVDIPTSGTPTIPPSTASATPDPAIASSTRSSAPKSRWPTARSRPRSAPRR